MSYPLTTAPATLADVISRIAANRSLKPHLRHDLCSGVRCLARAIAKNPGELVADANVLGQTWKDRRPAAVGLTKDRWASIRRQAKQALIVTGCVDPGYYRKPPFNPSWQALRPKLDTPLLWWCLPRLMRYCSALDIMPSQVSDATVAQFVKWLGDQGSKRDPRRIHREICRAWNHAVENVSGWPARRLTVPRYRTTVSLPWSAFPPSFKADADAWLSRLAMGDPFGRVPIRRLRPVTLQTYEWLVRYFTSALVQRGYDPLCFHSLADVVAIEAVREGLRYFLNRSQRKSNSQICLLLTVLRIIARTWTGAGKKLLDEFAEMSRALAPRAITLAEQSRVRLLAFDDPSNIRALLALPQWLAREADRSDNGCRKWALESQAAVAIELLLFCPVRIGVLARLELNRHIRATGSVHAPSIRIVIPAEEAMSRRDLVFVLPAQAARLLAIYVERFRPRLVAGRTRWLFPGQGNRPKCVHLLRSQISAAIRQAIGIEVNPFLFRHICAKLVLSQHSGNYEVVRRILGHRSLATTDRVYGGLGTAAALRHFDEKVLHLKRAEVARLVRGWRREGGS